MPSLKDLRSRIGSVKSTQKITSAMKMVAAAKMRRAQEQAVAARPYAERMGDMLSSLAMSLGESSGGPAMLVGTGKKETHLILMLSSDRGLCGGFNANLAREARLLIRESQANGQNVKLLCLGRKGADALRSEYGDLMIDTASDIGHSGLTFDDAAAVGQHISRMFGAGEFDVSTLLYARFKSAISQIVTRQQLIPLPVVVDEESEGSQKSQEKQSAQSTRRAGTHHDAVYIFEPHEEDLLADLLPRNVSVQIFRGLLENFASEQGARMTAMDNATRNASDMIDRLTLLYNRTRQAAITKELIEIISGAETV